MDRVYRLSYRMAGDDDLARDFTQETFIRAFERLDTFRGESAFSTWLHSIATTVALNGLRKLKRFRKRETDLEEADGVTAGRPRAEPDLKRRLALAIEAPPEGIPDRVLAARRGGVHARGDRSRARHRVRHLQGPSCLVPGQKLRIALADFAGEWIG